MHRRLYFLPPGRVDALAVIEELSRQGINPGCIHTLADKCARTDGLPQARADKKMTPETGWKNPLERNLISFSLAFGLLVFLLITKNLNWWLPLPTSALAVNFIAGLKFSNLPGTCPGEFRGALAHGEILLLVVVPEARSTEIERSVHRNHPAAAIRGVDWGAEAFGL